MNTKIRRRRRRKIIIHSFIRENNGEVNCDKSECFFHDSSFIEFWYESSCADDIREYFHTKEYFYIRIACSLISKINRFLCMLKIEKNIVFLSYCKHLLGIRKWKITRQERTKKSRKNDHHFLLSISHFHGNRLKSMWWRWL